MSGPIKDKILGACKAIGRIPPLTELTYNVDQNIDPVANLIELDIKIERIDQEILILAASIDDIRAANDNWTDLLRKLGDKGADEAKAYDDYLASAKFMDKMDTALAMIKTMRDLANKMTKERKLIQAKIDRDERLAQQAAPANAAATAATTGGATTSSTLTTFYALPTLHIQSFKGDRRKWPEFYESFKAAVHNKLGSNVEKLNLLRTLLEGEPKALIAGFRLEDKNYKDAIDLLRDTYGDEGDYIRTLHLELANLPRVTTLKETHGFLLEAERITRELKTMKEDMESPPIYLSLEKKLNHNFLRTVLLKKQEDPANWNTSKLLKTLSDAIHRETNIKEVMGEYGIDRKAKPQQHQYQRQPIFKRQQQQGSGRSSGSTIIQSAIDETQQTQQANATMEPRPNQGKRQQPGPKSKQPSNKQPSSNQQARQPSNGQQGNSRRSAPPSPCAFCGGGHWNEDCRKYPTATERRERIKQLRLCFKCLKADHMASQCTRPSKCFKCSREHPTAICNQQRSNPEFNRSSGDSHKQQWPKPGFSQSSGDSHNRPHSEPQSEGGYAVMHENRKALLMTTEATIFNPEKPRNSQIASIFIDSGSHRSFISKKMAQQLELPILETEECHLTSFGSKQAKTYQSERVKLGVLCNTGEKLIFSINKMDFIVNEMPIMALTEIEETQLQQKKLCLPHATKEPDVMLGIDVYHDLQIQHAEKLPSGFTLSQSRIGRILSGAGNLTNRVQPQITYVGSVQDESTEPEQTTAKSSIQTEEDLELEDTLSRFFGLHIIGLDDIAHPIDQDEVMKNFKRNLTFIDNRYQVALPWNHRMAELPTNYRQARARLIITLRKLREQKLVDKYQAIITDQEEKAVIEKVPDPETAMGPVHYLPHRAVVRLDHSTTKVRIVMDASAKPKSQPGAPSLNDCLHTGPLLLKELLGILIRFRRMKRLILADIEKAFLQLGVRMQDRDATRFLWIDKPNDANLDFIHQNDLIIYRFCRVSFGLTVSPFLLNATVREHLNLYDSNIAQRIQDNLYVDNILIEVKDEEDINQICQEAKTIFEAGGMKLQEFFTNEKNALKEWPESELAPKPNEAKVLGIKWTTEPDFLHFKYPKFMGKISKRRVLSTIAQVFDPLGLLSPTLLPAKLFMRKLHEAKLNWDEEMNPELQMEWNAIMKTWQIQTGDPLTIQFPRYIPSKEGMDQLHCFADASGHGIGVAIYQRSISNYGKAECNLIFAKALVKPAKLADQVATIPKMELQALTLGTKMSKLIQSQLEINKEQITLWSDSQCSIDRIKGNLKQDRFVTNRINKIRGNYKVKHVKSEDNPADIASRGMDPELLNCSLMWLYGPNWLAKPEEKWPEPIVQYSPETGSNEANENDEEFLEPTDNTLFELSMPATIATFEGIDTTKFRTWLILKRAITNAFRFLKKVSRNYEAKGETLKEIQLLSKAHGSITASEMKLAENFLFKQAQKQQPPTEVQKRDLNLYQEDGIWRSHGRIGETKHKEDTKRPIFLPTDPWITKLIIMDLHIANKHCGTSTLLSELRQKYWIPRGRKTIELAKKKRMAQLVRNPSTSSGIRARAATPPWTVLKPLEPYTIPKKKDPLMPGKIKLKQITQNKYMPRYGAPYLSTAAHRLFNRSMKVSMKSHEKLMPMPKDSKAKKREKKIMKKKQFPESNYEIERTKDEADRKMAMEAKAASAAKRRAWLIDGEKSFREREAQYMEDYQRIGVQIIPASPLPEIQQPVQIVPKEITFKRPRSPTSAGIRKAAQIRNQLFVNPMDAEIVGIGVTQYWKSRPTTIHEKDFSIFTVCDKKQFYHSTCNKLTLMDIANEKNRKMHGTIYKEPAKNLMEVIILEWISRRQHSKWNKWIQQQFIDGKPTEEIAKSFYEKIIQHPIGLEIHPEDTQYIAKLWLDNCKEFRQNFKVTNYGPIHFQKYKNPANNFENWVNFQTKLIENRLIYLKKEEKEEELNLLLPDAQVKKHFYVLYTPTVIIGDQSAETLASCFPKKEAAFFNMAPDEKVIEKLTPTNSTQRLIFAYCPKDEEQLLTQIGPMLHKFRALDIETHLVIMENHESEVWHKIHKDCYEDCRELQIGYIVHRGGPGDPKKIVSLITGKPEPEPMPMAPPQRGTLPWHLPSTSQFITLLQILALVLCFFALPTANASISQNPWKPWPNLSMEHVMEETPYPEFWTHYPELWHIQKRATTPSIKEELQRLKNNPEFQRLTWSQKLEYLSRVANEGPNAPMTTLAPTSTTTTQRPITKAPTTKAQTTKAPTTTTTVKSLREILHLQTPPPQSVQRHSGLKQNKKEERTVPLVAPLPNRITTTPSPTFSSGRKHERINDGGLPVYWCAHRGSTIWTLKGAESSPFCKPPPSFTSKWTQMSIDLYSKIRKPVEVLRSWHCSIKQVQEDYYTNFLGDKFTTVRRQLLPVTQQVCRAMVEMQECPYSKEEMQMLNEHEHSWASNNQLEVNFPGAWRSWIIGQQTSTATNCLAQPASLFYKPHNLELISPVHPLDNCIYANGFCALPDNTSLIWEPHCAKNCFECDYSYTQSIDGEFTGPTEISAGTWISKSHEQALTFEESMQVTACDGHQIRISEQHFGIREEQYQLIINQRQKRAVMEEQLAVELTATQLSTSRAINQLFTRECQRSVRTSNPTFQARKLINQTNIQARWIGENTIEVFSCVEIPLRQLDYRPTNSCYKYIPVRIFLNNGTFNGFLDPELRILSSSAPEADCTTYRIQYLEHKKERQQWLIIDTKKGTPKHMPSSSINELFESVPDQNGQTMDLHPLIFHDWILDNDSEFSSMFPHLEEFSRFNGWINKNAIHETSRAITLGALPGGVEGAIKQWAYDYWMWIVQWWIYVSCIYSTILFIVNIVAPLIIANCITPIKTNLMAMKLFGGSGINETRKNATTPNIRTPTRSSNNEQFIEMREQLQPRNTETITTEIDENTRQRVSINPVAQVAYYQRPRSHSLSASTTSLNEGPFSTPRTIRGLPPEE